VRFLPLEECRENGFVDTLSIALDATDAAGATNIPYGIAKGIEALSTGNCNTPPTDLSCGRPGAAHIIVLMTDGEANLYDGCDSACDDDPSLWYDDEPAKDCVIYYAREARLNAIVIYTITLGVGADQDLMEAVAEITHGMHRHAEYPEDMKDIFDEIYERIFVRLVH
jgi:hypothetical protein